MLNQDIYTQRSNLKIILAVAGGIILLITLFYSNFLADKLRQNEEKNAKLYTSALDYTLNDENLNTDIRLHQELIEKFPLPVVFEYDSGELEGWNFSNDNLPIKERKVLLAKIEEFNKTGKKPIVGENIKVYYFNSKLLTYIKYYPLVQILLVGLYVGLGYFMFNASRRAEQNRVWAGMAKETAHQLGTPISAMLGWMSYLREISADSPPHLDVVDELEKDVDRLNLVADRFSKIGSKPDLIDLDVNELITEIISYMQRRAPRKVSFESSFASPEIHTLINKHLYQWVLENVMRNALDAMDGVGKISCTTYQQDGYACVDITDTGKGIPQSKWKTVFQPGYSTKSRGWGLGLSLTKRIIEIYHSGKIYVKASKPDVGTTFTIRTKLV